MNYLYVCRWIVKVISHSQFVLVLFHKNSRIKINFEKMGVPVAADIEQNACNSLIPFLLCHTYKAITCRYPLIVGILGSKILLFLDFFASRTPFSNIAHVLHAVNEKWYIIYSFIFWDRQWKRSSCILTGSILNGFMVSMKDSVFVQVGLFFIKRFYWSIQA